jgi:putative tricarboxylic transport membrane protein
MGIFGLILSCVGLDAIDASPRMSFNMLSLWDGIHIVPLAMGLYGVAEIMMNIEETVVHGILETKIKNLFPTGSDWRESKGAILRGTIVGFFLGILPGGGPVVSSFVSYGLEKRISKNPDKFGNGAIEGVAGPESANNSSVAGAFIPFLTLGIPPNVTMAMFFGAFLIHGLVPGPFLLKEHPDVFWGVVSSMYIGNGMLLILNLPLIPIWVQVLKIPYKILFPMILLFCLIGAYSIRNNVFDIFLMIIFGIVGYLFEKFHYERAPLMLAFVLGPILEYNLRQSLLMSQGSFLIFLERPISAVTAILAILFFITTCYLYFKKEKSEPIDGKN